MAQAVKDTKMTLEEQLVLNLCNPELRGNALVELSKKRETLNNLAPLLWYSFGTIAALLQEIVSVYPALSPPTLLAGAANRACNALALLQTVAAHPETRTPFLEAEIPLYLVPFLKTTSEAKSFEYLRVTSLGVLGALAKVDDTEVVKFLLKNEVIPLCLRIMGTGSELSKTVATFIVQKIMLDEVGLQHICATPECFFEAANVLANMVVALAEQPSTRLLKHVIHCYIRLMDDPRACAGLRTHLPEALRNGTFDNCLRDDPAAKHVLQKLLDKLAGPAGGAPHPGPGPAAGGSHGGPAQAGPSHAMM
ncbi:cell differentiation protein rcd1-like isoform X1 [Panicum miliaceum]|uniref:Cell differentiation protein rcd1-like isoform X1 n=1 Tax=Panicum miliaceum TaxID=4540 RepID=A0A3L6QJQ1_PANMI|nr:cell differentiation protein rcd1-like isoform X1 [Panicum miliaceum]